MNSNVSISMTDNYGWVTVSVSSDLDDFFKSFVSRFGYIPWLRLLREVKHNNVVLSRVYRIGDVTHAVHYDKVHDNFLRFMEGAVYAA